MAPNPIVIAFCVSDSFIRHTAVVIASILKSNPGEAFVFHVLCGDLSADNRAKLAAVESVSVSIVCHDVPPGPESQLPIFLEHVSRETYFRFRIPELIDAPRVIYSDVDVLVRGPLRPLWETDLQGMPLGAVKDPTNFFTQAPDWLVRFRREVGMAEGNAYFYAGLLLMDCDKLRAEHATERLFADAAECARTLSPEIFSATDQVSINRVFQGRIFPLPARYCMTEPMIELFPKEPIVFRHYMGYYEKPWRNVFWNRTWLPYLRCLLHTPWRGEAWRFVLEHLGGAVWSVHTKNGSTRAFLFGIRVYKRAAHRPQGPRRYDAAFSIGNTCGCAFYLIQCDLRVMSGPLDWVRGALSFKERTVLVESRFANWMESANMTLPVDMGFGSMWCSEDHGTGIIFVLDFHGAEDFPAQLETVRARYLRRQKRFFETLDKANSALLVWFNCVHPVTSEEDLLEGFGRLRKALGEKVDLVAVEHDPSLAHGQCDCFSACDGGLRHFRLNLLKPGETTFKNAVLGDSPAAVRRLLADVALRPDLARAARRRRLQTWRARKGRQFLAALVPFRDLRRKIRGQV